MAALMASACLQASLAPAAFHESSALVGTAPNVDQRGGLEPLATAKTATSKRRRSIADAFGEFCSRRG
eukprot:8345140-Alexandrium_andersonii.AAC.1